MKRTLTTQLDQSKFKRHPSDKPGAERKTEIKIKANFNQCNHEKLVLHVPRKQYCTILFKGLKSHVRLHKVYVLFS